MDNYFNTLNGINVNDKTEKKNGLTYLSWAWAWQEVKKLFPEANYKIYENESGWFYHSDGKTAWVKTGVTVNGIEHIEYLPVMDYKNKSIPCNAITSFDVNKAIQRSLTKALARHGLGLYIYAGEDLPDIEDDKNREATKKSNAEQDEISKIENEKVNLNHIASIRNELNRTGVKEKQILAACEIADLKEMTFKQWTETMSKLENTSTKQQKDLGLK